MKVDINRNQAVNRNYSLKEFMKMMYFSISAAILTVDDLWGMNQQRTDKFISSFAEVVNAYGEDGKFEPMRRELEARGLSIRLGDDFFTKPKRAEKSRMMRIPCKINDEVWCIREYRGRQSVKKGVVNKMHFNDKMELIISVYQLTNGKWGETVFGTKEEAEKALEERVMRS